MSEEEDLAKASKFQSPLPFLVRLRNLVFGKKKPDIYTRITFYINTVLTITFLLWSIGGYFAIISREMIFKEKGIPVEAIIQDRGITLGFESNEFISRLVTLHGIGVICWGVVFFGLILLYRKRQHFVYFVLGGTLFYMGMIIFYLSFKYFIEDTTAYDKIAFLIIIVSASLHAYLMKNERSGGSISFFGEAEDDE